MNMPQIPAPATRIIGAGVLAVSLLAVTAGCSAGDSKEAAPAPSTTTATAAASPSAGARADLPTHLVRVIDGATIEVQPVSTKDGKPTGEPNLTVRMLGAAAPEASACGGPESTAHLKELMVANMPVVLKYEPTLDMTADKDGNTLAYAIYGAGVTQDLGGRMISDGYAAASYPEGKTPPQKFEQYKSDGKSAVAHKDGIWAKCPAPTV